ncbi:MAG: HAD family hydrolase [Candidatus Aenigmarchaeota archaeon]|nr:HAD family hydrolase [Candidatus Aenigmarchaeota archaeon]
MSLKCIIFDLSKTLVENTKTFMNSKAERNMRYLEAAGIKVDKKELEEAIKKTRKEIDNTHGTTKRFERATYYKILFKYLNKHLDNKTLDKIYNIYTVECLDDMKLLPAALEILDHCKRLGLKLILITNGRKDITDAILEKFGLDKYFDYVITSFEFGYEKSTLEPFKHVLEKFGLQPKECLVVGDRLDEDIAAKRIGMLTVWIERNDNKVLGEPEEPDFTIQSLIELKEIIDKLSK